MSELASNLGDEQAGKSDTGDFKVTLADSPEAADWVRQRSIEVRKNLEDKGEPFTDKDFANALIVEIFLSAPVGRVVQVNPDPNEIPTDL